VGLWEAAIRLHVGAIVYAATDSLIDSPNGRGFQAASLKTERLYSNGFEFPPTLSLLSAAASVAVPDLSLHMAAIDACELRKTVAYAPAD
jgi:hypothetical protein